MIDIVLGVDQSNEATGLACVKAHPDPRQRLHAFLAHPMLTGDQGVIRSVTERIRPTLRGWLAELPSGSTRVCIELAPPTMRADVKHGPQAAIGFAQGWLGGLVAGALLADIPVDTGLGLSRVGVHLVPVADWRQTMLRTAAEIGCPLAPPRRGRASNPSGNVERFTVAAGSSGPTSLRRVWSGCEHEEEFADLAVLMRSQTTKCPSCRGSRSSMSDAEAVRDGWKELACWFVKALAPEPYARVVAQARARARRRDTPDHHLAGVADACEAVGIALHGLQNFASSAT